MADPPSVVGAVHETTAELSPPVALTLVGAAGTATGVTAVDADDGALEPAAFRATTVNVYAVPFAKPLTVAVVAPAAALATMPLGVDVMVKPVMTEPPLTAGAVHATTAVVSPGVALTLVGASGTVIGVTGFDAADGVPPPTPLIAATVNVNVDPLVSPATVTLVSAAPAEAVIPPGDAVIV